MGEDCCSKTGNDTGAKGDRERLCRAKVCAGFRGHLVVNELGAPLVYRELT